MIRTVCLFALLVVVTAEPPLRFRSRAVVGAQRTNGRFGRLEQAQQAQQQPTAAATNGGYDYPKPMSSGYHYPKPDQAFPLPGEEMPPDFTTEAAQEDASTTESTVTTTATYEDYEDSTTPLEPAPETAPTAKLRRRQQLNARRPVPLKLADQRTFAPQRLENPATVDSQQQVRPFYLINLPESALQQLILLDNAQPQLATFQFTPHQPTTYYVSEVDYLHKKK